MSGTNRRAEVVERLRNMVLSGLTLGLIKDGDRLPGVRTVAADFGVDPRIVLGAYHELADRGVVDRRDRSGMYAKAQVHGEAPLRNDWVVEVAMEALDHGLRPAMLGRQLSNVFESRELHALVIDCNEDQLWSLSDELNLDYGIKVTTADLDMMGLGNGLPEMSTPPDFVVTTSFHVDEVAVIARELNVPMITVTMCTGLFAEVNNLMKTQRVYFVVSDARMARKLERVFEASEYRAKLQVLVEGRHGLGQIPDDAPVYITRLTRTRIPGSPLLDRCLPEARVFSQESARELISMVVKAGMERLTSQATA